MRHRGLLALMLLLVPAVLAADKPATRDVSIENLRFEPAELKIKVGETVTWPNNDERDHTVVSSDKEKKFKSPVLHHGETWSLTFDKPGKYAYGCRLHPRMKGTVIVSGK